MASQDLQQHLQTQSQCHRRDQNSKTSIPWTATVEVKPHHHQCSSCQLQLFGYHFQECHLCRILSGIQDSLKNSYIELNRFLNQHQKRTPGAPNGFPLAAQKSIEKVLIFLMRADPMAKSLQEFANSSISRCLQKK
jgi:hypothetical protein